ncbi:MAG: response regulator [Myxococcales bacterium]|nr:response regulator [Myxococcales bacterium]
MSPPSAKVLFIDDDPGIRRAFSRVLASRGFETEAAGSGAEALRLAELGQYPVVVTDLRMPAMDGLTLIEKMRPLQPHAAFVVVTGMPDLDLNRTSASTSQIDGVLSKPWNADELEEVMRRGCALYEQRCGAHAQVVNDAYSVLVIEDNAQDAETIRAMLAPAVAEIVLAERLAEGLQILRARDFDAVLADLSLPDARGLDVVVRVRTLSPESAVVILGGLDDEEIALRGVQMGVQDYLSKRGMDQRTLRRTLRYAVERKRAEQSLAFLARHDQLTGLANRTTFQEKLNAALARARRQNQPLAVLFVDVDRFKAINDSLGHEAGDLLLKTMSQRLLATVREYDTVARIGGDEFAVLLEDLNGDCTPRRRLSAHSGGAHGAPHG